MAARAEPLVKFHKARPGREQPFLPGLPARDLPLSEWETYPEDVRAAGVALGLYRVPDGAAGPTERGAGAEPPASDGGGKTPAPKGDLPKAASGKD